MAKGKKAADRLMWRNGVWYYRRRVPTPLLAQDRRGIVRISLKTDDRTAACLMAESVERDLEAYWASLAGYTSADARERYEAAIARARLEGFVYKPIRELAAAGAGEIAQRMLALEGRVNQPGAVEALLGGAPAPQVMLSGAMPLYQEFSKAELLGKRPDQVKRWRQARELALDNFIKVLGEDKALADVSRDDARRFRDWWLERIANEGLGRNAANKQIGMLSRILSVLSEELRLDLTPRFTGMMLTERKQQRPTLSCEWVEDVMLRPGALGGLNDEARGILLLSMETGISLEEATSLLPDHIRMADKVPHITIISRDEAQQKTEYRPRDIPLVGVSLLAAQSFPAGFTRYQGRTNSLSAVINKFLRTNKLLPDGATFYSLRHAFQDRLTAAEAPERLQADLMGHKFHRERYGQGPSLAQKQKWLEKIAYKLAPDFKVMSDAATLAAVQP